MSTCPITDVPGRSDQPAGHRGNRHVDPGHCPVGASNRLLEPRRRGCAAVQRTVLNNFAGTESIEDGSREVVRVALLGPDGPTNTFTRWKDTTIPW